jgi:hypothetical protein
MVFHFTLPKGTQPSGLSFYFAKGDAAQWSFLLLCQKERNPVVFPFTFHVHASTCVMYFVFIQSQN